MTTKIFFDIKFTGFHKLTTPISIGLVAEDGREYYAEFSDVDQYQVSDSMKKFTESLTLQDYDFVSHYKPRDKTVYVSGEHVLIKETLLDWLEPYKETNVEMWGDGIAFQWVLFVSIFGNDSEMPGFVGNNPMDLITTLNICNLDPNCDRNIFAYGEEDIDAKNSDNALNKAYTSFKIYQKIVEKFEKPDDEPKTDEPKTISEPKISEPKIISEIESQIVEVIEEVKVEKPKKPTKKKADKKKAVSKSNKPEGAPDFIEPTQDDIIRLTEKWNHPLQ
jgi:hypothetical protein